MNADNSSPDDEHGMMSKGELEDIRQSDASINQYRYDCALAEEYKDGNQFSLDDIEAGEFNGIGLVTANFIKPIIDDVRGIQESALTSWKVKGENPEHDDQYDALGAKLFEAARITNVDRARIRAYGSQINVGVGWLEIGRQSNPLLGKYAVDDPPWREMFYDMRARKCDLSDGAYIRRIQLFDKDRLKKAFDHVEGASYMIDTGPTVSSLQWMNIEPEQNYRAYTMKRPRDIALAYQKTQMDERLRTIEEVWRPIYLEGCFATMPDGKVMLYEGENPMLKMMVKYGIAKLSEAPYTRWRRTFWCGEFRLDDCWSPYPWLGHPYIAFFGYREGMTNVPYGITRGLISLQDEINSSAAKFHFGMDAVRIILEEKGLSDSMTVDEVVEQAANKRGVFLMKAGKRDAIKFDHHYELNEQNYKRAQDAKADMRSTSGVAGLNPGSAPGGAQDAGNMNAVMLRALANLGELAGNYNEASTLAGERLLSLVKEDIADQENVGVNITKPTGARKRVVLHTPVGEHPEFGKIIANDVTLLKAEVALEDVPHTVTYRGQQLQDMMKLAQSAPPEMVKARAVLTASVVKLSDTPDGAAIAQSMLEEAGVVPPSTPEAKARLEAQQQEVEQQKQLQLEDVLANIAHRKAQTQKLISDSELKHAMAQSKSAEVANPQYEEANRVLLLERTAAQNRRTHAQADKIEAELSAPPPPAEPPGPFLPQRW